MSLVADKTTAQPEKRKRGRPATKKKTAPQAAAFEESHALANFSFAAPLVAGNSPLVAKPSMANALPLSEDAKPLVVDASPAVVIVEQLVEPA